MFRIGKSFHKLLDKYEDFVVHYIDEILIFSKCLEVYEKHRNCITRIRQWILKELQLFKNILDPKI